MSKIVDIFEYAMQMEKDGENFYRDLAVKSSSQGVTRILTMLADDEVKHYNIIKAIAEEAGPEMTETTILADAKNVFAHMEETAFSFEEMQIDLYHQAQEIEQRSQAFYEEKAEQVADPAAQKILLKIADEEQRHYFLLDNIIEFMNRPINWIEDAEFNHLDEY